MSCIIARDMEEIAVQQLEDRNRCQGEALVAVHQRVVLDKGAEESGSFVKDGAVKESPLEGLRWLSQGRLQQADAVLPAQIRKSG